MCWGTTCSVAQRRGVSQLHLRSPTAASTRWVAAAVAVVVLVLRCVGERWWW